MKGNILNSLFQFLYQIHRNKLQLFIWIVVSFIMVMVLQELFQTTEVLNALTLFYKIILFPFDLVGGGLRALSLSSAVGNVLAIILFMLISVSPITVYLINSYRKQALTKQKILIGLFIFLLIIGLFVLPFAAPFVFLLFLLGTVYMIIKKIRLVQSTSTLFYFLFSMFLGITLYLFINPTLIPSQLDHTIGYLLNTESIRQELKLYIEHYTYIYKTSLIYTLLLLILIYLGWKFYHFTKKETVNLFTISSVLLTILKFLYVGVFILMFILNPAIRVHQMDQIVNVAEESNSTYVKAEDRESESTDHIINQLFNNQGLQSNASTNTTQIENSHTQTYEQVNIFIDVIFEYTFFVLVLLILRKLYQLLANFKDERLFERVNVNLLRAISSLIALILINQFTYQFIKNCYQLVFIAKLGNAKFALDLPLNHIVFALAFYLLSLIIKQSYDIYEDQRLTI